jgi:hypothetical protein
MAETVEEEVASLKQKLKLAAVLAGIFGVSWAVIAMWTFSLMTRLTTAQGDISSLRDNQKSLDDKEKGIQESVDKTTNKMADMARTFDQQAKDAVAKAAPEYLGEQAKRIDLLDHRADQFNDEFKRTVHIRQKYNIFQLQEGWYQEQMDSESTWKRHMTRLETNLTPGASPVLREFGTDSGNGKTLFYCSMLPVENLRL